MMKFYDSDLASDNPVDFHSDHEPPKDKIKDKKLLKKTELRRFHKIIIRTGSALPKPAKYDEVSYRILKIADLEKEDENIEVLKKTEVYKLNLGLNDEDEWFDLSVESMKKDEIALIMIENLKYDDNKFKVLDSNDYYYIQLIEWTTVIDLDANFNYMKKILTKGKGLDRCDISDEVSFKYKILFREQLIYEKYYESEIKLENVSKSSDNIEILDANVLKILRTMKPPEHCTCHIKYVAFEATCNNPIIIESISKLLVNLNLSKESAFVDIEVEIINLIKNDDLFHDHSALKRQLQKGRSTSKPESNAMMYFDMQIKINSKIIFNSWESKDECYKVLEFPANFGEEKEEDYEFLSKDLKCVMIYLDEFKLSKVLKIALKRMKKGEIAEVICRDMKLVNKGIDKEAVDNFQEQPNEIRYLIKLYNFIEGKNAFTMTLEEKVENAKRKRQIGLELIKQSLFKRALKSFENINTYFELGSFNKEELELIKHLKLSSLLNTTFCQMKMNKWKELILVADKILAFDDKNCKTIYRKTMALKELSEHDKAFECINEFLKKNEQSLDEESKKELLILYKIVEKQLISYKNKEKKMFTQMFNSGE